MITNADLFHYLEWEATKIVWETAQLLKVDLQIYKKVKKINKAFASVDDINTRLKRVTIVLDDYKVICQFDYKV